MNEKEEIIKVLKLLHRCPIKTWADLSEDASQNDVWEAQAEWIRIEMDKMYF